MKTIIFDIAGIAGLASVGWGIWQVHQPSAWIAVGLCVMAASMMGARKWGS